MKDKMTFSVEDVANLFAPGEPYTLGCESSDIPNMISYCKTLSSKQCCTVKDWQLWTLQNSPLHQIIYAGAIIEDEMGRFDSGNWIRTSQILEFHEDCICETRNTFYILVGEGTQKDVPLELAYSIP